MHTAHLNSMPYKTKNERNNLQYHIIILFIAMRDIILIFCHMNVSGSGALNCEEFLSIYDANTLQWDLQYSNIPWYRTAWWPLQTLCTGAHIVVKWSYFETLVCK